MFLDSESSHANANLLDIYELHYEDNIASHDVRTHYAVLPHHLRIGECSLQGGREQHSELRWWSFEAAWRAAEVHPYTKAYVEALLSREARGRRP